MKNSPPITEETDFIPIYVMVTIMMLSIYVSAMRFPTVVLKFVIALKIISTAALSPERRALLIMYM